MVVFLSFQDRNRRVERTSKYAKINNFCLIFLTAFAMMVALIFMKPALVPLVFSFFLYGSITSLVRWTSERLKVGKWTASFVVFAFLLIITYECVMILLDSFSNIITNIDTYRNQVIILLKSTLDKIPLISLNFNTDMLLEKMKTMSYSSYVSAITGNVFNIIWNFFLILTFVAFFILGEKKTDLENPILKNIFVNVTTYVSIKLFTSILSGVIVAILLMIFKVDMAVLFGFLTIILNFIPTIGSIIATLLPLPIILLQYGTGWQMIFMITLMTFFQVVIGNILDPKIMGEGLDLHPVTILVFLIFWGLVWGMPGLFLAVPITSILKIVLSRIENTRVISEILSGRLPK
jgi:AI-2 transport protein TqsA